MNKTTVPSVGSFAELERFAKVSIDHVCWPSDFPYAPEVALAIAHTSDRLLLRFDVTEDNIKALCTEANGPVWKDSCCEFFVKVPDTEHYFNFETNCIGTGLAAKRLSRENCEHFAPEQMAKVLRRSSLPPVPVDMKQTASWSLELEVPFALLGCEDCPERLLANFYKCGDGTNKPHYLSWNPVMTEKPDFHRPEYFGELILEK